MSAGASACFVYAGLHLLVALPLQMAVVRRAPAPAAATHADDGDNAPSPTARIANETLIFALLAVVLSIAAGIGSIVVVHLLIFLQARGVDFAVAVSLGTLFGPAQVGARVVERLFGNRYHPIWTMIALLHADGDRPAAACPASFPILLLIILLYGAGYGISWIGRGTLPLALFGPVRFPRLMGKLAFPSLIVQALAPSAGALLIEASGANATIGVLTVLALINVVLIGAIVGDVPATDIDGRMTHADVANAVFRGSFGRHDRAAKPRPWRRPTWSALPRSPATAIRSICPSISPPRRRSAPASRTAFTPRA